MSKRREVYGKNKLKPSYFLNTATGIAFLAVNDGNILKYRRKGNQYDKLTKEEYDEHKKNEMLICDNATKDSGKSNFNIKWLGKKKYNDAVKAGDQKFKIKPVSTDFDNVPEDGEFSTETLMKYKVKALAEFCDEKKIEHGATKKAEYVEAIIEWKHPKEKTEE